MRLETVTFLPVSYTHLDVYKRQGSAGLLAGCRVDLPVHAALYKSVSYTHLDVYKRQGGGAVAFAGHSSQCAIGAIPDSNHAAHRDWNLPTGSRHAESDNYGHLEFQ